MRKLTNEDFIKKAVEVHGDKYDYSQIQYINNTTKVKIICPSHGEFRQTPISHLQKNGCIDCGKVKPYTTESFIERSIQKHGNRYDYSLVEFINIKTDVQIICKEHGIFLQQAHHHMNGSGCPTCAGVKPYTTESFIEKAVKKHNKKYDYSKVNYINSHTEVNIICTTCGYDFWQMPYHHTHGNGCPYCANPHLR